VVCAPKTWPLMKLFEGVDALVGAGGYNTVHEARATCVPLLATAQARLYDRQLHRLHADERVAPDEIVRRLQGLHERRGSCQFDNGAHDAVHLVEGLLRASE